MTTVQYYCDQCSKNFSFVFVKDIHQPDPCCPWCDNKNLVLVHRETWEHPGRRKA